MMGTLLPPLGVWGHVSTISYMVNLDAWRTSISCSSANVHSVGALDASSRQGRSLRYRKRRGIRYCRGKDAYPVPCEYLDRLVEVAVGFLYGGCSQHIVFKV